MRNSRLPRYKETSRAKATSRLSGISLMTYMVLIVGGYYMSQILFN